MSVALAPWVREVDLEGEHTREDYWTCVLWCPECAAEPMREVRCPSCPEVHREGLYGPYLTCNACGSDLIWVVIEAPDSARTEATS